MYSTECSLYSSFCLNRFAKSLVTMVMHNPETNEIGKPTELLQSVRAYMNVLQSLENYVHIDITRVFNNVLLQQVRRVREKSLSLPSLMIKME